MDRIMTWDLRFGKAKDISALRKRALGMGVDLPTKIEMTDTPILQAIVNAGRWVVQCPYCAGAEYAREDKIFMCQSCWNGTDRKWLPVVFPPDRQEIEAILIKRMNPGNRNWRPGETIDFLKAENMAKGVK